MGECKTYVIAVGGNAIIDKGEEGTVNQQFSNTRKSLKGVVELIKKGKQVVLTHGNGPIVGNILIRNHLGEKHAKIPSMPLGICVADSQGGIGYMIQQSLQDLLIQEEIEKEVVTLLTQVVVDPKDHSIQDPTKPIGPFYSEEESKAIMEKENCTMMEDAGRGYRRVVASPFPIDIVEKNAIKSLIEKGFIVIAAGGGGIPVFIDDKGWYEGVDAVVDKDYASYILGKEIGAECLVILTTVEKVALHFGQENEELLGDITLEQAKHYYQEGHFPAGSMGPKIKAAILFLEDGGKEVIITSIDRVNEALEGKTGTKITQ